MHKIDWAATEAIRERGLNRFDVLAPESTALIVVDMQTGFLDPSFRSYCPQALDVAPNINWIARAMRAAGGVVVHTRQTTLDDPARGPPAWQRARAALGPYFASLEPGAAGHRLHPVLEVAAQDLGVDKVRYSAFLPISSTLDLDLRARRVDTVVITGTVTNICCESSARDAHMMGYRVYFVADATAAMTDEAHNASLATLGLSFADVRRTEEMLALLAKR